MKTINIRIFTILLILISGLSAVAQDLSSVQVTGVEYSGDGCPDGTVQSAFTPDASQFSLLYSAFVLNVGGTNTTESKSCTVKVRLKLPLGYTINVESADFRGFVQLDGGVFAHHTVDHQIGSNKLATFGFGTQIFAGPRQENYLVQSVRSNIKLPKILQCLPLKTDVTLNIRTRVKLTGAEGARVGMMTVDSADGQIEQKYRLSLKRCF